MTIGYVIAKCFSDNTITGTRTCNNCGSLVDAEKLKDHLGFHHPDPRNPGTGETFEAPWKRGLVPDWARDKTPA